MQKFFKNKESGFTLVETLVAISIFSMSILGLLSILASGISNTTYAKEKMTATYLAQEGIEYIRNMRDTFVLYDAGGAQTGWNDFNTKLTNASCQTANGCYFGDLTVSDFSNPSQPMAGIAVNACSGTCPSLLYNTATGKYNYDISGVNFGLVRKIQITPISADEIKISSTVYWRQGSGTQSVTFSENLFNWIQ